MRMGRYSRVFVAMALMLFFAAILVRGCKLPRLDLRSLTGNDAVREYLNDTYEAKGVGVTMMGEKALLITLINPRVYGLEDVDAQEAAAREIAEYVLDNQEGLPELEQIRVRFEERRVAGAPVSGEYIFDFTFDELR